MATDTKQMSRDELQQLAEQTLKRREQQKARQKKIREAKRAAGLRSVTFWHPEPPTGYVPVLLFVPSDIAKDIKDALNAGKTPSLVYGKYQQEEKTESGIIERQDVYLHTLSL